MSTPPPPYTAVLIQGDCARTLNWQPWLDRYTARGYGVIATRVPLSAASDDCLGRRDPAEVTSVVTYYERLLQTVTTPTVLIGHCFGGTVVQLLIDRGLGAAGIALNAPPAPQRRPRAFGRPGPGSRVEPAVDYRSASRAPLLLIGGGRDRDVPAELIESAASRYQGAGSVTGHLEYPDACHHTLSAPGWEQIADDVLDWSELQLDSGRLAWAHLWRL